MMHIRHRQDTDLFYLADNPTSERHSESCDLHTVRATVSSEELQLLKPVVEFHPYKERNRSERNSSTNHSVSKRPIMSGLEKLFATLITNSFTNYQFGRYQNLPDFMNKVINSEKNKAIGTPWGKTLTELCYYGPKGLEYAQSAVKRLDQTHNQIPASLWFNYAPAGTTHTGTSVTVREQQFTATKVQVPHKASGPFLMVCTISKQQSDNQFRDILLVPIVSKDYIFAVHSDIEREILQAFLPKLFRMNSHAEFTYYLNKPAWPVIDNGAVYWPNWLLHRKSKSDRKKSFKVISDDNVDVLADIYGVEVIHMSSLLAAGEVTW
ncbi:hypothetical protein [Rheinheimera hassiensis]|uniref:hypothetical protein n=1 Tax=Rheinheimera hassiensis TaxID=1193627 RepID=UPI001F0585D0|nr:hypothetical protein [Rheinheimera hassiensis]